MTAHQTPSPTPSSPDTDTPSLWGRLIPRTKLSQITIAVAATAAFAVGGNSVKRVFFDNKTEVGIASLNCVPAGKALSPLQIANFQEQVKGTLLNICEIDGPFLTTPQILSTVEGSTYQLSGPKIPVHLSVTNQDSQAVNVQK